MPDGSERDPFEDLRATLEDEEEPFITVEELPDPPVEAPAAAPVPPPLPPRRAISTPPPLEIATPPPPTDGSDPFREPPEPRPPKSGALEEKVEYFRVVLRQKQETLSRARSLYAQKDAESAELRASVDALTKEAAELSQQLDPLKEASAKAEEVSRSLVNLKESARSAVSELEQLRAELATSEDERRELSKALAAAEAEATRLSSSLEEEKQARLPILDKLKTAKQSHTDLEDRIAKLSAAKSEMEGTHEALNEQYFSLSAENERLSEDLSKLGEEVKTAAAERDAANAELSLVGNERDDLRQKLSGLESQLANHSETTQRVQELEEALGASEERGQASATEVQRLREELEGNAIHVEQERARAQAAADSASQELEELRSDFDQTRAQFKQQLEQERRRVREDLTASFTKKLLDADKKLEALKVNYAGMEAQLADVRRDNENYRQSLKKLEQTADRSNQQESVATRKLREDLTTANRRATDAMGSLQKERNARESADKEVKALAQQVAQLQRNVSETKTLPDTSTGGSAALVAERDQLRADIASMKKKLVAAESAIEAAASLKAKVVRLEAELKKKR